MKVFRLNDVEWWAGSSLEEVIEEATKITGVSREDLTDSDTRELTEKELDDLIFFNPVANVKISFREELNRRVQENETFPCFFASSEY
jgi:hypothetical protein